ncbi:hypothetical protein [Actinoplanes subtropicus]|uniref:hypothetical protein n=1 Tax=Actinoplanes subtropicus TaxID=543632 RepID=UPI0004C3CDDC|nr:hypothetical protein [Actinoplanes subtropicus]
MQKTQRHTRLVGLAAAAAFPAAALIAGAQPAQAAVPPVLSSIAIAPAGIALGSSAQVTATATNTTAGPLNVSMGIDIPAKAHPTHATGTNGCTPRLLGSITYCGVTLPAGASATLTITSTPSATGSYDFTSYGRIAITGTNDTATATLTVALTAGSGGGTTTLPTTVS